MKKISRLLTALVPALFAAATLHAQVPNLIGFQGRVVVGTTNFTGNGQFKFALVGPGGAPTYWSNDGTSSNGSQPSTGVTLSVSNGFYSVHLGDPTLTNMTPLPSGGSVFNNLDVRLRIWFNNGVLGFQQLSPDQRIVAVGYASRAAAAGTITGNIPASQVTGTFSPAMLSGGSVTNTLNFAPASGSPFTVGNPTKVANLNSDLLDGMEASAFVLRAGDSMSGELSFGANARQMLNLYNTSYGIGIQTSTLYQRSSGGNFAWFKGGIHSDAEFDPGAGGLLTMRLGSTGQLHTGGPGAGFSLQNRTTDSFVANPASGERWEAYVSGGIYRLWSGADRLTLENNGKVTAASITLSSSAIGATISGTSRAIDATTTGTGITVRAINGSGGSSNIRSGVYGESTEANGNGVVGVANNGADAYAIWGRSTSGYAGKFDGKVEINGNATVKVLTITGGADLAEPFEMKEEELMKGSVVVIDEEHPGRLKQSGAAYDRRVAGIISGANGVNPGIALHQEGVMEGGQNVALSGRVYVRADTSSGPINPGDLLTTSGQPGHAMRVKDHGRAQGAVIGKAMSRLNEGAGLVLVLVTLQ